MLPWILIAASLFTLFLSFFSIPLFGFAAWSISLLVLGFSIGLLVTRKVTYKIIPKARESR